MYSAFGNYLILINLKTSEIRRSIFTDLLIYMNVSKLE